MAKPDRSLPSNLQTICASDDGSVSYDTESVGGDEWTRDRYSPTAQQYGELHVAYDFFNLRFFHPPLPRCLITMQPRSWRVMGYYSNDRFLSNRMPGTTTDEIALNPVHFQGRKLTEVLQTLCHEMCHLWQQKHGKPSRRGYHNKEWAQKMISIGLHPSSTGKPGGAIVGQHMSDYLVPGGPLDLAIQELISRGFAISWYDRLANLMDMPGDDMDLGEAAPTSKPPPRAETRPKYSCSICGQNAWAKRNANLVCGKCKVPMLPRRRGEQRCARP